MWKFLTSKRKVGTQVLSPGGKYIAMLGVPVEVWGNYLAPLALWTATEPRQLLYHRQGHATHALDPSGTSFLYWSRCGNWLSFYEIKRQETYQIVFLDVTGGIAYRVPSSDVLLQMLPETSRSIESILALLQHQKHVQGPLICDPVSGEELSVK